MLSHSPVFKKLKEDKKSNYPSRPIRYGLGSTKNFLRFSDVIYVMLILKSTNILDFPFQEYSDLNATDLDTLATSHQLTNYTSWLLPQLVALFGSFKLRKDGSGKYCPSSLGKDNFNTPHLVGIWKAVRNLRRSLLVKGQNTKDGAHYSALVPLVLAGIKKYQNVPYSAWAKDTLDMVVDPNLVEAARYNVPKMTRDRLLELRKQGLTIKSGDKAGSQYNPTSTWCLKGLKGTELAEAPKLATSMLGQIWVAHPTLRNEYMILDPNDWDSMPEPLFTDEVLIPSKPQKPKALEQTDLPWL